MNIKRMKKDIVDALYSISANNYSQMCDKLGLSAGTVEEAYRSKKKFVYKRIDDYGAVQLVELMRKIRKEYDMILIPEEKYSYVISPITKKEIAKLFTKGLDDSLDWYDNRLKMTWNGDIDELEFIKRVIDIDEIEIIDHRCSSFAIEYKRHRIDNNDYDDNYFFVDDRLPYKKSATKEFLDIICVIFHPEVRNEEEPWEKFLKEVNILISADGFEIYESDFISNRPVYSWRKITYFDEHDNGLTLEVEKIVEVLDSKYIESQVTLMKNSLITNTAVAIGKAKELLESCFKYILDQKAEKYNNDDTLMILDKKVRKILGLEKTSDNKDIPGFSKITSALSLLVHGISELRNSYGDGHGKNLQFNQLDKSYATLTVNSSINYISFLLEMIKNT